MGLIDFLMLQTQRYVGLKCAPKTFPKHAYQDIPFYSHPVASCYYFGNGD